jgi:uncharacterized protein (DUF58 family)
VKLSRLSPLSPTPRLAAVVALTAPVWLLTIFVGTVGLVVAFVVTASLLLLVVFDAFSAPARGFVHLQRTMPGSAGIGDSAEGSYRVTSSWARPSAATVFDAMPAAVGRHSGSHTDTILQPFGEASLPIRFTPVRRGEHKLGSAVVRVTGVLGLVRRALRFEPDDSLLVTPSLAGVRRYRLLALQHRLRDAGVRVVRRRGEGTNFAGLREYAVGDDPRRIDWKATARRGKVISREYTVEQGQTIMIAIDAGRMMTQLAGELPRFEHALSSALVLTDVALHSRDQVGLIVFDDEVRTFVQPARGTAALEGIRNSLVAARATMVEPDYAMAFRTIEARHRKRSLIVLFTDVIDSRSSQAIVAYTARSAIRHLPLVVALRNDQLAGAAEPRDVESSSHLYESAAAEELVSAREAALLRMRRAGVSVLDISPRLMTAAVINRYLELKARSSL